MWIWEQNEWPALNWDKSVVDPLVSQVRLCQGVLIGVMSSQSGREDEILLDTLSASLVHSCTIEGGMLNGFAVRSSLARKMGLHDNNPVEPTVKTDAMAEIMVDAVNNLTSPLTLERLKFWHERMFPEVDEMYHSVVGGELRGNEPVRVVSGGEGNPVVHFEAPGRAVLESELESFIGWFNASGADGTFDPLIRAAIAHLWFITLQPFPDGNGRISRLLTDLALAQAEPLSIRYYAMSVGILESKQAYYDILEVTQKGDLDVTTWLVWFFTTLLETFDKVLKDAERPLFKAFFWNGLDQAKLAKEQLKLMDLMLDGEFEDGISAKEYLGLTKVSKPTASRHLTSLVDRGCLVRSGAGRSVRYYLRG